MLKNYVLSEKGSNQVIAVIKDIDSDRLNENFYPELVNKVGQAIEDDFCYDERVKVIHDEVTLKSVILADAYSTVMFYMSFTCIDDDGDVEIREVELNQIAIY